MSRITAFKTLGTIFGAYLIFERIQPVPAIHVSRDGGAYDRNPPKDPKAVISLQNASFGALVVHKIQLYSKGHRIDSFKDALASDKYILCNESFKSVAGSKELFTIRPTNVHDHTGDKCT